MVNPLQDQLLKAGLIKAHQINKVNQEKRRAQHGKVPNAATEEARQARQHKAESDRSRNREQQAEQDRKAQAAQIRQLVEAQRLARSGGDSAFQFIDAGKIKKIHLHAAQRAQLIGGMLAVVKLGEVYELVPAATAEKIAARDPSCVLVLQVRTTPPANPEPDPYADYPVPDDLTW